MSEKVLIMIEPNLVEEDLGDNTSPLAGVIELGFRENPPIAGESPPRENDPKDGCS